MIDPFTFIPQQETSYGTNLHTEDVNSFSSGHDSTSLEQQNYPQTLPWETIECSEMDMISHICANNQASYPLDTNLMNQKDSLPSLPSGTPLNYYPDSTILNPIPGVMNEQSLQSSVPLESHWTVNSDASTMAGSNNVLDQQSLLPPLPSEIPWNLDSDSVLQAYHDNFFDEQNFVSPSVCETPQDVIQHLSSHHVNLW